MMGLADILLQIYSALLKLWAGIFYVHLKSMEPKRKEKKKKKDDSLGKIKVLS